jgi:Pyruvate/2-oxoacid:ferredoxin oxidoreductase delta subunit
MVPSPRSVTVAVGHGKRAARHIGAWLNGTSLTTAERPPVVTFPMLHLPVFSDADPAAQRELPVAARDDFSEIMAGLSEAEARREAQRCLSCGVCFECDNCYAACPEDAIVKLDPGNRYRYDYARCTGCAACFEQCPCHAIQMTPETVEV